MYNVHDVANFYLSKAPMSPKKLQKILYYAYSWYLTLTNENVRELDNKLFEERFEAWVHGPVIPEIYTRYRGYGSKDIIVTEEIAYEFDTDTLGILNDVWEVYGHFNGNELESITHQESPWLNARGNCSYFEISQRELSDEDIFMCYIERVE